MTILTCMLKIATKIIKNYMKMSFKHDDEGDDYWSKYTGESSKQKQFMVFSFDETTLSKI